MSSPRTTKVTRGEMLNTWPVGIRHVTEVVHGQEGEQDHTGTCTKDETGGRGRKLDRGIEEDQDGPPNRTTPTLYTIWGRL